MAKIAKEKEYIISACLIGKNCSYNGTSNYNLKIKELFDSGLAIAVCPEELGGLKIPRPPCEIFGGSGEDVLKGRAYVFNKEGRDVTINVIKGSKEFLSIAEESGVKKAILKSRSPCCGKGKIYDGTFANKLRNGNGITTALLLKKNIEVITDEEFLGRKSKRLKSLNKKRHGKVKKSRKR